MFFVLVLSACSSSSNSNQPLNTSNFHETTSSTDVVEITTTTENPAARALAIAYDACKTWRKTEFAMIDNLNAAYPYSDSARHALIAYGGALSARDTMREAAIIDESYSLYVSAITKWIPFLWRDYKEAKSGRSSAYNSNEPSSGRFGELCAEFGIYSSSPGLYPPIDYVIVEPSPTPLNGARKVCHDLFFISPDQVVFYGKQAFTLNECDNLAHEIANFSDSFQNAKNEMISRVFGRYDQWCWYQECKSRWDI
jgi:hypothetical protein